VRAASNRTLHPYQTDLERAHRGRCVHSAECARSGKSGRFVDLLHPHSQPGFDRVGGRPAMPAINYLRTSRVLARVAGADARPLGLSAV
jgi:hypothetical protein